MNIKDYVLPTSLVVPFGVNIDTFIYLCLLTIFHPLGTWILRFGNFELFSEKFCFTITLLWIIRGINKYYRSLPNINTNRTVLITGGSNGLGLECVKSLNSDVNISKIIVVDLCPRLEFEHFKKVEFLKFDLNNDIEKLIQQINLEEIDVMVLNAGKRQTKIVSSLSTLELSSILNINLISNIRLLKSYIEISTQTTNKRRHIVVIGSVLGFVGPCKLGIYSCTKISLLAILESLQTEIPSWIRLSMILPGQLNSQMFADVSVNEFLAPIIDIRLLSLKIRNIVNNGENGSFAYPMYGRLLPVYQILPWWMQKCCRWFSGMDNV